MECGPQHPCHDRRRQARGWECPAEPCTLVLVQDSIPQQEYNWWALGCGSKDGRSGSARTGAIVLALSPTRCMCGGVTTSVCVCVSVRASAGQAFLCVSERDDVMCRAVCPCFVWVSVRVECVSVWVPTRQRAGPGDSFPPSFRAAVQAGLLYSLLLQNGMSFFTLHGTSSFLFCWAQIHLIHSFIHSLIQQNTFSPLHGP